MIERRSNLSFFLATLAATSLAAGVQAAEPGSRPVVEAREITAPQRETFGDYVVHYAAQMTTMVPADVARSLGIIRGSDRAMLNVTVLQLGDGPQPEPVTARIEVEAANLTGQLKAIPVRELHDGDSVYYIGEFTVAHEEILTFEVRVRPEGADGAHEFSFQQQFFID